MLPAHRIPLNLIVDYPVYWSKYKVLRDLLQNFYDSVPRDEWNSRFSHRIEGSQLKLMATDVGFSYDWLVPIGASTKRDGQGEYAGYFGEGFKIAALCAVRDHGWDIQLHSQDWRLQVVTETVNIDGRALRALAYDVHQGVTPTSQTVLTLSPFKDLGLLDAVLQSFFYPDNPLLGEPIWSGPTAAVFFRSSKPKPSGFPATDRASGPGIVFAGFQALGSLPHPLIFCLHDYRSRDRDRSNLYLMDVINIVDRIASRLPPDAAARVLQTLGRHWYEYPRKQYDFDSWYPIIQTLVRKVAACPEASSRWRQAHPALLVAEPVRRSDLPRYNRRRQALAWWRANGRQYRLVQNAFRALGYPDLESLCAERDGFTVTRAPTPLERHRIDLLEVAASRLLPDLLAAVVDVPPCCVIDNRYAVWQGMISCVQMTGPDLYWRSLRVRYRLSYVALKATLLADGDFGQAMSTYLHEVAHMFGGDSSASFSHALSEMLQLICSHAESMAELQRQWDA